MDQRQVSGVDCSLGYEPEPIKMPSAASITKPQPIPPYNGFGSEEDSLGSVYSLQPKAPRKDVKKMFKVRVKK